MKPYDLLSSLLEQVEQSVHKQIKISDFATQYHISDVHLQRIFTFMFGIPLARYIRSRRLAISIESLLDTDLRIIDIAIDYGFEYERTYIRAFKREFGITPGEYRKSGIIAKITPPLKLHDMSKLDNGLLLGPEIVMVPAFQVVGRLHKIVFDDLKTPAVAALQFEQDMGYIPNVVDSDIYIGLTRIGDMDRAEGCSRYLPSVQVKSLDEIPEGFTGDSFPATLCARFRYIGEHHYRDIDWYRAEQMYKMIMNYKNVLNKSYLSLQDELFFEKIDISAYDGKYCQMEWFTPIKKR